MSTGDDDRLPQRFRTIFTWLYDLFCVAFVFTIAFSATYGAYRSYDDPSDAASASITPDDADGQKCISDIDSILQRAHDESQAFFGRMAAKNLLREWSDWSDGWRRELESIRNRCQLRRSKPMKPILAYTNDVERVHMGYDRAIRAFHEVARKAANRIRSRMLSPSQ